MKSRGLIIDDEDVCRGVLRQVGYYHLSGYGRYFQVDPHNGRDEYQHGTTFETIALLQRLDSELRLMCLSVLASVELALRTGFAYHFGRLVGSRGKLLEDASWHASGSRVSVAKQIMDDLERSRQPFIVPYRTRNSYNSLPVWMAVECVSFGTLSRAIEHCVDASVVREMASELNVTHTGFSSQVRSFVSLRNACAHATRLWNDVSHHPPSVPNNVINKAKRRVGQFHPQSYYRVFVALSRFSRGLSLAGGDFAEQVDRLIESNKLFRAGLMNPAAYR